MITAASSCDSEFDERQIISNKKKKAVVFTHGRCYRKFTLRFQTLALKGNLNVENSDRKSWVLARGTIWACYHGDVTLTHKVFGLSDLSPRSRCTEWERRASRLSGQVRAGQVASANSRKRRAGTQPLGVCWRECKLPGSFPPTATNLRAIFRLISGCLSLKYSYINITHKLK